MGLKLSSSKLNQCTVLTGAVSASREKSCNYSKFCDNVNYVLSYRLVWMLSHYLLYFYLLFVLHSAA